MVYTDPDVGAFTLEVADGAATFKKGETPDADLVMKQSSTTFEKTLRGILDPSEAIQSGLVQANNFENLGALGSCSRCHNGYPYRRLKNVPVLRELLLLNFRFHRNRIQKHALPS